PSPRYRLLLFRHHRNRHRHPHTGLLIHPRIQQRLLEPPPVPQLERRNESLGRIPVERIPADAQILRRLPDIHHLANYRLHRDRHHTSPEQTSTSKSGVEPHQHDTTLCTRFSTTAQQKSPLLTRS